MASKLSLLMELEGFEDELEFLEHCSSDSVVPGICCNRNCDYTTEVEPDCSTGYCEECSTQTVRSALVLAGII